MGKEFAPNKCLMFLDFIVEFCDLSLIKKISSKIFIVYYF